MSAEPVRLTQYSPAGGCGCKLGPGQLGRLLDSLPHPSSSLLKVGFDTRDDAAIFELDSSRSLVVTNDFFTPIVDSAADWGAIAAANALSDVYAMGGRPLLALSIAAWPDDELPIELLSEVIAAADRILSKAGAVLGGGHTIHHDTPMFGLAVVGQVETGHALTNACGEPGQRLILTKPIGVGVIATAIKNGAASEEISKSAVSQMTELNLDASAIAHGLGIKCATDVSGFGLLGHAREIAVASGLSAEIRINSVPLVDGAAKLAADYLPSGASRNRDFLEPFIEWSTEADPVARSLLFDPQTSGGLLLAVAPELVDPYLRALREHDILGAEIGALTSGPPGHITVADG